MLSYMGKYLLSGGRIGSLLSANRRGGDERYYYSMRMRRPGSGWAEALGIFLVAGGCLAGVSAAAGRASAPSLYVVDRASRATSRDVAAIYRKCAAASAKGTPIYRTRPIFASTIDRDADGVAC